MCFRFLKSAQEDSEMAIWIIPHSHLTDFPKSS